nr:topoisomerase C-terminal repeat-containing protein [Pseudobdellovibrionaceae bacterium]
FRWLNRREIHFQEERRSLPENESPADLTTEKAEKLIEQKMNGADSLGLDPATKLPVYVLNGRFGPYVQLGESQNEEAKPKRMALPAGVTPEQVDLVMALKLLELPKTLGVHPVSNKPVQSGIGRFGPYVVHQGEYRSVPKTESIFDINLEKALALLNQPKKSRGQAVALKEFPALPNKFNQVIHLFNGPYGHYLKSGKVNASLPEGLSPELVTHEKAIEILQAKGGVFSTEEVKPKSPATTKKKSTKAVAIKPIKASPKAPQKVATKAGPKTAKKKA